MQCSRALAEDYIGSAEVTTRTTLSTRQANANTFPTQLLFGNQPVRSLVSYFPLNVGLLLALAHLSASMLLPGPPRFRNRLLPDFTSWSPLLMPQRGDNCISAAGLQLFCRNFAKRRRTVLCRTAAGHGDHAAWIRHEQFTNLDGSEVDQFVL